MDDHLTTFPNPASFLRLVASAMGTTLAKSNKPRGLRSLEEYDIDPATGFFPPKPLPRLSGQFEIWEDMLEEAKSKLSLGSDMREGAVAKRPNGDAWRPRICSVSPIQSIVISEVLNQILASNSRYRAPWKRDEASSARPHGASVSDQFLRPLSASEGRS